MLKKQLFSYALLAFRHSTNTIEMRQASGACWVFSRTEALDVAATQARLKFPAAQGWTDHAISVDSIDGFVRSYLANEQPEVSK